MFDLMPFGFGSRLFPAYDPFKELEEFERRAFSRQLPALRTDIRETEDAYLLDADLAGFSKDQIHAEIADGVLTIRAERKDEQETKNENERYLRRERTYGSYVRRFDLTGIRAEDVTATYRDGVLSLTLPKEEPKKKEARKLEIQTEA